MLANPIFPSWAIQDLYSVGAASSLQRPFVLSPTLTNTHHHTEGGCRWGSWWGLSSQAPKVLLYRAAVWYCTASIQWNCGASLKDWQHPTAAKGHTFTWLRLLQITGLPGSTVVKNLPANAGDIALTPGWGNRKWQPTPVFLPGKFHEQRSLASYSPGGCKELDMTGHTHTYVTNYKPWHC